MAIQINQKKYERQSIGQNKWRDSCKLGLSHTDGWGVWWWETGVGKTFSTVDVMRKMVNHNNSFNFIIVVPGPEIQNQWSKSIKNLILEEHQNNFKVLTIHKVMEELKNGLHFECTMLVLDELHEYYSEERIGICKGEHIKSRWCLGLTANYEDIQGRYKLIQLALPVVDRIDTEEAVREGYISKYVEFNVGLYLTNDEKEQYDILTDKITKNGSKFGNNGIIVANTILKGIGSNPKDYSLVFQIAKASGWKQGLNRMNEREREIDDLWAPGKIIGYASNYLNAIRERKNIIYNAINKLKVGTQVVVKFDDLKTICFSETTTYADALSRQINEHYKNINPQSIPVCVVYHSNLKTIVIEDPITGKQKKKGKIVLKREAMEMVKSGKARVLSTTKALDKGLDIPDIRLSLTTSGTQNPTQYNQRKGRAVRVEDYENMDIIVLIVNLYVRNTIDEKWLRTRQSKSNNVIYYVDSVDDINYSPKKKEVFNIQEV